MNLSKKFLFPLFTLFSALGLAGCAAYYSMVGISTLFSGAFISVCIMALFLEIGKICSVTFAYRYWNKCKLYLKSYLVVSILILMIITSMGIFGYLSSAFQKSSIEFSVTQEKITTIQDQKSYYRNKIESSNKRIDDLAKIRTSQESRMNEVITNEYISRNPIQLRQLQQQNIDLISDTDKNINNENTKIQDSINNISKIDDQVNQLKLESSKKKDIQTFKFVADALKLPLNTVATLVILLIISVFDPLAICLILAYNVIVYKKENESIGDISTNIPKVLPESIPPASNISNEQKIKKTEEKSINNKNDMTDFFKKMFKIS